MTSYKTNGYIIRILEDADSHPNHSEHAESTSYLASFRNMEDKFFERVHSVVDVGLAISETQLARGGTPSIYTVHGCRHVADLISSLDTLTKSVATEDSHNRLTVLEAYILLCAAHVHDAANVSERNQHPQKCSEIISENLSLFANTFIAQQIFDVASVHGDKHETYGKDTFRLLDANNATVPRLPLLAALLRLADELSENPARVPELVAKHHEHSDLSKLAFAYARSFARFQLRGNILFIVYNIYPSEMSLTMGANPSGCNSFLEYLELKIDVIERETRYCSQYGRPILWVSTISITIQTYSAVPSLVHTKLSFDLELGYGYPDTTHPLCERSEQLHKLRAERLAECLTQTGDASN